MAGPLGLAFDPEGVVVSPRTGHLLVSDEYGPSLRNQPGGQMVRTLRDAGRPAPRDAATGVVNLADDTGNTAGKRTNRGFEGLGVSPTAVRLRHAAERDARRRRRQRRLNRIVKFDTRTGRAVAQYAYRMEGAARAAASRPWWRSTTTSSWCSSATTAAWASTDALRRPNKKVFRIDFAGATDVSARSRRAGAVFTPVESSADALARPGPAAPRWPPFARRAGGVSPEKWEGLTIGPRLADGSYLVLAGTDNDYSVTQNGTGGRSSTVYFKPGVRLRASDATSAPSRTAGRSTATARSARRVPAGFDFSGYRLIPGVLHAYKASAARGPGALVRPHLPGRPA